MKIKPIIIVVAVIFLPTWAHADWIQTYVLEWVEPAMYYGAEAGVMNPGSDCPAGTNPEIDWVEVMVRAGYTREEAEWLRNPANPTRSPVHGQNQMAFRGKNRENVYANPESYPDPGLVGVTGNIGQGLNLDGNTRTGFTSPQGEKGIDNAFYKALGCWKNHRGPERLSSGALSTNDAMRNGAWTVVVVVHGEGDDPLNDKNVTVGFYPSEDKLVKGGDGDIARDYTFAIAPHKTQEAIFDAYTINGQIVSTKPMDKVVMRDTSRYSPGMELLQAQIKLNMKNDGTISGYVGGYRPWRPIHDSWVSARGTVIEVLTWIELPGMYYSLKRNADYSPSGTNGEKTHISFAMSIDALPAFVMKPGGIEQVDRVISYKNVAPTLDDNEGPLRTPVVDGIVVYSDPKMKSGPNVNILPGKANM